MKIVNRLLAISAAAVCLFGITAVKSTTVAETAKVAAVKLAPAHGALLADDGVETHGKKGKRA